MKDVDPHNPQYNTFSPGGGGHDLLPVGAGANSVLPAEVGEGATAQAESERGTFPPRAGKSNAFPVGAVVNSVLPTEVVVNSTVHSSSEQIEARIGRSSSPRSAVVLSGPTRIITPLMETTPALLGVEIEAVPAQAVDLVEWRVGPLLAALKSASDRRAAVEEAREEVVSQTPLPVLTMTRTATEGGTAELSTSECAELVVPLAGLTDAVDVETVGARVHPPIIRVYEAGTVVIASFHDFSETPPDDTLAALYAQTVEVGVDILKVACRVTAPEDALHILAAQIGACREHRRPIIGIGMEEAGAIMRIAGAPLFSVATFASVATPSAPGRFTVEEMRRGLDLVEKGRTVERRKSDEEEETVDRVKDRWKGS